MVVAVAGLAISAYGAYSSSQSADEASSNQQSATQSQAQAAKDQLDFGKQQYSDWKGNFEPGLKTMGSLAMEEVRPDYAGIDADVGASFDSSQGINRRTMQRFGVQPTDGSYQASETQYGLGRALGQVNANNTARTAAKNTQFNRLATFEGIGAGQQAQANGVVNAGSSNLGNAYGNAANMYGHQSDQYSQAAAAGAQMAGRFGANIASNNTFGGV
ncbi:MAG: hypothetical protein ABIQ70_13425 [Dokdonella sp.]